MMENEHLKCTKCNLIFLTTSSLKKHIDEFCKFKYNNNGRNRRDDNKEEDEIYFISRIKSKQVGS